MQKLGIDVSMWQGDFDFEQAKKSGVEFAIIKLGGFENGRYYTDSKFERNYMECDRIGMSKGAYFFGSETSVEQAKESAKYLVSVLKGHKFDYPIYYDVEGKMLDLDRNTLTSIVKTFCSELERNGFYVGIYASYDVFDYNLIDSELKNYCHWVASWHVKEVPKLASGSPVQMWQFGGGKINQITSGVIGGVEVDQNYCYYDYPSAIKQNGLNNYPKQTVATSPVTTQTAPKKSNTVIVNEVIKGLWGVEPERTKKLTEAGYDAKAIQKIVDSKLNPVKEEYYTVKKGDCLDSIAKQFGTTIKNLTKLNSIKDVNMIMIGQKLRVK